MHAPLLILSLLTADDLPEITESAPEAVIVEPAPDLYGGESDARRVRFGIGPRVHAGVLSSSSVSRLIWQSEIAFFITVRVLGNHEWRMGLSAHLGWPDIAAGESNTSFRLNLTPRFSIGLGAFAYWGLMSMRGGLDVPIGLRFGPTRKHEIAVTVRGSAGLNNDSATFVWYDFKKLRPAFTAELSLGYSAIF